MLSELINDFSKKYTLLFLHYFYIYNLLCILWIIVISSICKMINFFYDTPYHKYRLYWDHPSHLTDLVYLAWVIRKFNIFLKYMNRVWNLDPLDRRFGASLTHTWHCTPMSKWIWFNRNEPWQMVCKYWGVLILCLKLGICSISFLTCLIFVTFEKVEKCFYFLR